MDQVSLAISAALDRAKEDAGLTLDAIVERMGASSPAELSRLLRGRGARTATYARILDALNADLVVSVRRRPGHMRHMR